MNDNCYAQCKPPKPVIILVPPQMVNRTTQTNRDIWRLEEPIESFEESFEKSVDLNDYELDPNYAKGLIDAVLDCFSDTASEYVAREKYEGMSPEEIAAVPFFELADIMGEFGRDSQGNIRILKTIRKEAKVPVPIDRQR